MKNKKIKLVLTPLSVLLMLLLVTYCLIIVAILAFTVMTALKDPFNYDIVTLKPDKQIYPWNFVDIFEYDLRIGVKTFKMLEIIGQSFLYAGGCGLVYTIVVGVVSYLCAVYKFKFSKIVYNIVIITMVIPIVGSQASELRLLMDLGLHDKWIGLIVLKSNFLGVYFLVLHSFFDSTPLSFKEAAQIDGASDLKVMLNIYFPLAKAIFGTVFLVTFITYWNDYQTPIIFAPSHPTLSRFMIELSRISHSGFQKAPMQMATTLILILPTFALFLIFQKKLLSSISVGGIKG